MTPVNSGNETEEKVCLNSQILGRVLDNYILDPFFAFQYKGFAQRGTLLDSQDFASPPGVLFV